VNSLGAAKNGWNPGEMAYYKTKLCMTIKSSKGQNSDGNRADESDIDLLDISQCMICEQLEEL
jgi:hypothetical protein